LITIASKVAAHRGAEGHVVRVFGLDLILDGAALFKKC